MDSPEPQFVHFLGQCGQQQQQIRYRQAEQIKIGGRVHIFAVENDDTGAHIADKSGQKYNYVKKGHRNDNVQRISIFIVDDQRPVVAGEIAVIGRLF